MEITVGETYYRYYQNKLVTAKVLSKINDKVRIERFQDNETVTINVSIRSFRLYFKTSIEEASKFK